VRIAPGLGDCQAGAVEHRLYSASPLFGHMREAMACGNFQLAARVQLIRAVSNLWG